MTRTFIEIPLFTKKWHALGLDDDDLRRFQQQLLKEPKSGDIIPGTGHLRKVRVSCNEHGKRGGERVIYVDIEVKEKIYLLNVYAKNVQTDLTETEKKAIVALVKVLKEE